MLNYFVSNKSFKKPKFFYFWLFLLLTFFTLVSDAKAVLYEPGETLNPACSPTDLNCDVRAAVTVPGGATAGSLVYATSTDVYAALSIGSNGQILKVKDGGLSWSNDEAVQAIGKAGGQTIIGGTEANNALIVQANSAISGNNDYSTAIKFKVGNNGATEALTILNNGDINVNGDISMTGDIIPSVNNTYSLGSPTKVWRDVYIGPGSLYVNGQKVLQTDDSDNVAITADVNQSLLIKTFGTGDIELNPSGSGQILLKGDLRLSSDKRFVGTVNFDNLSFTENTISVRNLNGGISLTPNGIGGVYVTSGNFGVGTTSPAEKLDVAGNLKLSGALMPAGSAGSNGQFLVSQGSGLAPLWVSYNTANWSTAYGWGNHAGLYDLLGTASSSLTTHETAYNHSLIFSAIQSELDPVWNSVKGTYALKSEIPTLNNLTVSSFATSTISQWINDADYTTLSSFSASSPLSYNSTSGIFSLAKADLTTDGYLSSVDWNILNNKLGTTTGEWLGTWQGKNYSDFAASTTISSQWATTGSDVYYSAGNIGIGTSTPSEKLDVFGNLKLSGALMPNGLPGNTGQFLVSQGSGITPQWTTLNTANWDTAYNWGSHASAGYLNLDQTTPQTTVGTFTFPKVVVTTDLTSPLLIGGSGVTSVLQLKGTTGNGTLTSPAIQALVGNNGATAALTFLNNGNVGIGTTTPSSKFHLFNSSGVSRAIIESTTAQADMMFKSLWGNTTLRFDADLNGGYIQTGNYDFTGNQALNFSGYNGNTGSNVNFKFSTSYFSNNVGIGNNVPSTRLQVAGHFSTDIVTSDMGYDYKPIPAPTPAPTLALTSGTALNIGQYWYTVTYYTSVGETSKSVSTAITTTAGNQSVIVTFPISTNPAVIGRKIYRTVVGSTNDTGSLIATIANNTATTYTDVTPDASLSADRWIGYKPNTTAKGISLNGVRALLVDPNLTLLGSNAGISATSPGFGTFIGANAGRSVTYGFGDTFIGYNSGWSATTPGDATMVGSRSGFYLTTGANNTGVGSNALQGVTTGTNNTALGFQALLGGAARITGTNNSGVGTNAIAGVTTGSGNNALGSSAMSALSTGSYNNAIGVGALQNQTTGSYNIALGYAAGRYITGGSTPNTISAESIFIGYNTRALADNQTNEIVIGSQVTGLGSNTVVIGNSSITKTVLAGNIGIGTTSPAYKLDVVGDGRFTTSLTINSLGTGALYSNAGVLTNTDPSDVNLKQNILNIDNSLSKLMSLRPVSFEWKNNGELSQGFVAQEVETILPELVGQNPGGYKGLYTTRFIPYIVKAIQEQQSFVDYLKSSDTEIFAKIQEQKSLLDSLSFNISNSVNISNLNKLALSGGLEVSGHVAFSGDTVGEAEIISGDLEIRIMFTEEYLEKPIITATPKSALSGSYWIADVDAHGFTIKLKETQTENISFYWHAFAKKGDFFPVPEPTPEVTTENNEQAIEVVTENPVIEELVTPEEPATSTETPIEEPVIEVISEPTPEPTPEPVAETPIETLSE